MLRSEGGIKIIAIYTLFQLNSPLLTLLNLISLCLPVRRFALDFMRHSPYNGIEKTNPKLSSLCPKVLIHLLIIEHGVTSTVSINDRFCLTIMVIGRDASMGSFL